MFWLKVVEGLELALLVRGNGTLHWYSGWYSTQRRFAVNKWAASLLTPLICEVRAIASIFAVGSIETRDFIQPSLQTPA
jgi:hypothetical protein